MEGALRRVVGVALLAGIAIIAAAGFVVRSEHEFALVLAGFAAGLGTAWMVDQLARQPAQPRALRARCEAGDGATRTARLRPRR
ncbi:MAG: hypothetical protein ACYC4R_12290 [Anaerolineae bacterium]